MRIAVFHDFLDTPGGAERVALLLAKRFDADLITTNLDPSVPERLGLGGVRITNLGSLRRGSPAKHLHASWRFARARFPGYDRYVLSGNWAVFAAKRHRPNLWYCLTPTRAFYDQRDATLGRLSSGGRLAARAWIAVHGAWERRAVRHADRIVGISRNVQERIRRYYGRESDLVYPPVETSRFRFQEVGDFWLAVTRLYPEKRIDLLMETFRRLPSEQLRIVGGLAAGDRAERYVRSLDPPANVALLGSVPQGELEGLYARCRGLLATAVDEDFGLTPVEAMASGKAVLAADEGGYRETVVEGRTGVLLPPNPEAFAEAIRRLTPETLRSMRDACIARAKEFDDSVFFAKMETLLGTPA